MLRSQIHQFSFLLSLAVVSSCGSGAATNYLTRPVGRGDISSTISATGTLQPEELVDVGAQVAGMIEIFGKDSSGKQIDFGSTVEEGTVLAEIDDSLYAAEVASAVAHLAEADAGEIRARADLEQLRARALQTERDWTRAQSLIKTNAIAQSSYDSSRSAYDSARANVSVGEAVIQQSQALKAQAEAALARAQRNLSYCTIRSPVRGVIIDRRVNIGQTVVSSLNAPSLFLIAKDLRRMQLWVSVNEADIGRVKVGQKVSFTVDAFPGEDFTGEVTKVRLNAAMTQNVVSYTVEVMTDNSNLRLLPYLTANVRFHVEQKNGVLAVPNAALRWSPPEAVQKRRETPDEDGRITPAVWINDGGAPRRVAIQAGLTDGQRTEVLSGELRENDQVIIGQMGEEHEPARGSSNPFVPQMGRRH